MANNRAALDRGFKKAKQIISGHIFDCVQVMADRMIDDAISSYRSKEGPFTGNAITSYACGLYIDGVLSDIRLVGDKLSPPVHIKVQEGETLYLERPYSGKPRTITGMVDLVLDKYGGEEGSITFLTKYYQPKVKKGFELVMCTGAEYSVYQEKVWSANFLTDTYIKAQRGKFKSFKPLP